MSYPLLEVRFPGEIVITPEQGAAPIVKQVDDAYLLSLARRCLDVLAEERSR